MLCNMNNQWYLSLLIFNISCIYPQWYFSPVIFTVRNMYQKGYLSSLIFAISDIYHSWYLSSVIFIISNNINGFYHQRYLLSDIYHYLQSVICIVIFMVNSYMYHKWYLSALIFKISVIFYLSKFKLFPYKMCACDILCKERISQWYLEKVCSCWYISLRQP